MVLFAAGRVEAGRPGRGAKKIVRAKNPRKFGSQTHTPRSVHDSMMILSSGYAGVLLHSLGAKKAADRNRPIAQLREGSTSARAALVAEFGSLPELHQMFDALDRKIDEVERAVDSGDTSSLEKALGEIDQLMQAGHAWRPTLPPSTP
jgi:hypothetical protein